MKAQKAMNMDVQFGVKSDLIKNGVVMEYPWAC